MVYLDFSKRFPLSRKVNTHTLITKSVQEQETPKRQESRAIDALYRISTLTGKHINPVRALEAILDEVMQVFSANSASISLLNASSESLLIEVQRDYRVK